MLWILHLALEGTFQQQQLTSQDTQEMQSWDLSQERDLPCLHTVLFQLSFLIPSYFLGGWTCCLRFFSLSLFSSSKSSPSFSLPIYPVNLISSLWNSWVLHPKRRAQICSMLITKGLFTLDVPRKWFGSKESGFWNKSYPLRLTTSMFPLQHSLCLTFSQIPLLISAWSSVCAAHFTAQGPNYIFQLCSRLPQSKIKPNNVHFLATTLGPLGSSPWLPGWQVVWRMQAPFHFYQESFSFFTPDFFMHQAIPFHPSPLNTFSVC